MEHSLIGNLILLVDILARCTVLKQRSVSENKMATPNPSENGETTPGPGTGTNDHPGVLSKLSNTIQAIKMPWNKDEQGVVPTEDAPPADTEVPLEGQAGSNVFSATMSKVSNTLSNIQMPWTNKDAAPGDVPATVPAPASDSNVLTDAFSKVTNTISNIQMPWTNKNEPQNAAPAPAPEPVADEQTGAAGVGTGSDNVLASTLSKVSNTLSNMQMPWSSKGEQSAVEGELTQGQGQGQTQVNGVALGQSNETPLDKVTGFFSSVFKPGTAQPTDSVSVSSTAESANTDAENSSKAQ